MEHGSLIAILVLGIVLSFILAALAHRLRLSPLVGYLLAGVAIGPFTPGFVADQALANQLAEIGVILLMFGVGLHFSPRDLLAVKGIAVPGALLQIACAAAAGTGLGRLLGWDWPGALIFGLSLSIASTVVTMRTLQDHRLMETGIGRVAVGWLVVEDFATVLALILIPALLSKDAGPGFALGLALVFTFAKIAAFVVLMLVVGQKWVPALLHWVAHTGSRELFRLAVLAIALGIAFGASELAGVSFALGAFVAGMVLSESSLSQRAAEESLPLRDAFAVLFFVSVGMLFNPRIFVSAPGSLALVMVIILAKPLVAFSIVLVSGRGLEQARAVAAVLPQIGEFSFILVGLGISLGLLAPEARDLILAGSILSILLNPVIFALLGGSAPEPEPISAENPAPHPIDATGLEDHVVLIGYGRVGALVGAALKAAAMPFLVIEDRREPADAALRDGAEVLIGNAADPRVLEAANLSGARQLFVAIPLAFEAGQVVQQARRANPELDIVARAHSDAEVEHLSMCGADLTIMGEREIARRMAALIGRGSAGQDS